MSRANVSSSTADIAEEKVGSSPNTRESPPKKTRSEKWTAMVNATHVPIIKCLQKVTSLSARNPKRTVSAITAISLILVVVGFATNFYVELSEAKLWTPKKSQSMQLTTWTASRGYYGSGRFLTLFFHAEGKDVLGMKQVQRMFDAYDVITGLKGYEDSCKQSWYYNSKGENTCEVRGPVRFWNSSSTDFQKAVHSDEDAAVFMSSPTYPDEYPVVEDQIYGQAVRSDSRFVGEFEGKPIGLLTEVKSYYIYVYLAYSDSALAIEKLAIDAILDLDQQWRMEDGDDPLLFMEISTGRSFGDEFMRGIYNDLPLGTSVAGELAIRSSCSVN
jgi:hypothetical protein